MPIFYLNINHYLINKEMYNFDGHMCRGCTFLAGPNGFTSRYSGARVAACEYMGDGMKSRPNIWINCNNICEHTLCMTMVCIQVKLS